MCMVLLSLPSFGLFRHVKLFETGVSGLRICPKLSLPLKMGQIGTPETSVSNHLTPLDNPGEGRILFNPGESLVSRACC